MMRKLLLFFAMLSVSIGAWAGPAELKTEDIGLWSMIDNTAVSSPERVILLKVKDSEQLKNTLNELNEILTAADPSTLLPEWKETYYNALNTLTDNNNNVLSTGFITEKRLVLKVVFEKGNGENDPNYLELSADAITALNNINVPTIDLQDSKAEPFTFANANVKRVILPDGWSKADVTAAGEAIKAANTGFEAAFSQDGPGQALVAYVNKPGSLYLALRHTHYDGNGISKLGNQNQNNFSLGNLKYLSLIGNPSARDFNGATDNKYDADGHFLFNVSADETSTQWNAGIGGESREPQGTPMIGAIVGANPVVIDLEDAVITNQHCDDLNMSWSNIISDNLKEVRIPTTSELTILPADFLNVTAKSLEEICIPGNIEIIRTRAIYLADSNIRHIWTTGTKTLAEGEVDHTIYDNGAYLVSNQSTIEHTGHAPLNSTVWNCNSTTPRYGTITLPPNLTLIESHSIKSDYISDVYSLSIVAPECHVDAFSSIMYMGNNRIEDDPQGGMITRWSYAQSQVDGKYISFLHYPRECVTPDIQRYTDVTREYSVATTLRDGKGNIIYFPNQSELNRAYYQGTTGYLWFAWNSHRTPESWGNANSFDQAEIAGENGFPHTTANQQKANELYIANTYTEPKKTDRSFYDVRLDATEQPSLEKPADLDWYYKTKWEGKQLYPEIVATSTQTVIGRVQSQDADGHLLFESGDCNYVQDYSYVQDNDGTLYWDRTVTENENGNYVQDYSYVQDADGIYYHPFVKETNKSDDKCNAGVYYYFKSNGSYSIDPNGNYIDTNEFDQYQSAYYATIDQVKGWGWTDEQIASYTHYSAGGSWVHLTSTSQDNYIYYNTDVYYVSENYAAYSASGVVAGVNETRYKKVYADGYRTYNASTDAGEQRYDVVDNGLRAYNSETDTDNSKRYKKVYKDYTYREFDSSKDAADEPRYCPTMENVYAMEKGKQNDYRGWHQFILTAYATNDDRPFTPVKFYQTDNDWWTVCLPYDLKYNDMIKFFGNETTGAKPYLSKLRYVVRDYDKEKITLMFSKNLMVYKEVITNPTIEDDYVHGVIDDVTTYTSDELAANPVILHKGVPYLIKPNIPTNANRSFDVYLTGETANPDLYQRLVDAQNVGGGALETYIYKGEYTVPAYVIGENIPTAEDPQESRSFTYQAGPTFTYKSTDKITYGGQEISAQISGKYSYTFVGSFFLSILPENCYFLGWDSKKKCAAFWFNRTGKLDSYDWNNQTGIICPNFKTETTIHQATGLSDPARWKFTTSTISNDDLVGVANSAKKSLMDMDFGSIDVVVSGIGQINLDRSADKAVQEDVIYDLRGVRMNQPKSRLTKGVYIVNGKKYVVE